MFIELSTGAWFVRLALGLPKKLRRVTLSLSAHPGRSSEFIAGSSELTIRHSMKARHADETVFTAASGAVHACKPANTHLWLRGLAGSGGVFFFPPNATHPNGPFSTHP